MSCFMIINKKRNQYKSKCSCTSRLTFAFAMHIIYEDKADAKSSPIWEVIFFEYIRSRKIAC